MTVRTNKDNHEKLLGIFLTLVVTQVGAAGWEKVVDTPSGATYVHTSSIVKDGYYVTAWILYDRKKPFPDFANGEKLYLSTKTRIKYNCNNETWQFISTTNFVGNMGEGSITGSRDFVAEPFHSLPDRYARKVFDYLCAKP